MSARKLTLLDHPISTREQQWRYFDAERLSGFKAQEHFIFCALLYWQFARLFTFEDAASVDASQTVSVDDAATIAHQATSRDKQTVSVDRG